MKKSPIHWTIKESPELPVFEIPWPVNIVAQETGSEVVTKRNLTPPIRYPLTPAAAAAAATRSHETPVQTCLSREHLKSSYVWSTESLPGILNMFEYGRADRHSKTW